KEGRHEGAILGKECRARYQAMYHEGAEHYGGYDVSGDAECKEGYEGRAGHGTVAGLRRRNPLDGAFAEAFGILGYTTREPIVQKGCDRRPQSGNGTDGGAYWRGPRHHWGATAPFGAGNAVIRVRQSNSWNSH